MCGLVVLMKKQTTIEDLQFMQHALDKIKHRGPDDERLYVTEQLILGFNRLSIIDLEGGAQQPFHSSDGLCHLVFNGEIYNYLELRHQLEKLGFYFETSSEAEVILTLYQLLGLDFMTQLRGMFSLVLYDEQFNQLVAVRDRFGIKPLYYYAFEEGLFLTSELKVFKFNHYNEKYLDFEALQHYFTFQYIKEPATCLKDIKLLEPGTFLTYSIDQGLTIQRFATVELLPTKKTSYILKEELQQAILKSVQAHLQSNVEVGCFLSGGLDSTIIATCAKVFKEDLKAFTLGFEEEGDREIPAALQTAEDLNLDLKIKTLTATQFLEEAKLAIHFLDTPLADPSSVAIYSIAKEARKEIKVILSGEGADELFGGYQTYKDATALKLFNYLPTSFKSVFNKIAHFLPSLQDKSLIQRACIPLKDCYLGKAFVFNEKEKQNLLSFYQDSLPITSLTHPIYEGLINLDSLTQMQMVDIKTSLPGDLLVKSDRLTMAHALELRVPFLDQHVLELTKYLSWQDKIKGQQTKILLREAFADVIPLHAFESHQKGYAVPLKKWLKNELFDEARDILLSKSCEHLINQKLAISYLESHAKGKRDYAQKIWTLITFILWYESWMKESKMV